MGNNLKRTLALFLCVLILIPLYGCSVLGNLKTKIQNDPKTQAKDEAEEIFGLMKDKDLESLTGLFSPEMQERYNIRNQWKIFFEHIDGNLVSYKSISMPGEGQSYGSDGEINNSHYSVNYSGVKTDNGTVYSEFGYYKVATDRNNPETEGINVFTMKDPVTGEWISVGGE